MKHLEAPCNRIKQSDEIRWKTMKQSSEIHWNTLKQHEKEQWNILKLLEAARNTKMKHIEALWIRIYIRKSLCFMTMKHTVSSKCFSMIRTDSRCFMSMKQNVSPWFILSCFYVFHDHGTNVSLLIHPNSTRFAAVSSLWFILCHANSSCFVTVSGLLHQRKRALIRRLSLRGRTQMTCAN